MSEKQTIEQTIIPITKQRLIQDLAFLKIDQAPVLTHIALSKVGWISGGAVTMIQALLESIKDQGTLVMPTQSGDNSDPALWENPPVPAAWIQTLYETMPAYDKRYTPTRNMGRTAELFRTYPNVLRSDHPLVSFAAIGKDAETIINAHVLTPMFGEQTPLDVLYKMHAKILLVGTDFDVCTALHYSEYLAKICPVIHHRCAMIESGERRWVTFKDFEYDSEDFAALGRDFEKTHTIIETTIGQAHAKLIDMKTLIDFGVEWLLKNRKNKE